MCRDGTNRSTSELPEAYKAKGDAYLGEPVYVPTPLTLLRVLPTLPPPEVAASVDIITIFQGKLREQLADPESLLLPESESPPRPPKATAQMADEGEWPQLAHELWGRGLCTWLPTEALFAPGGNPLVSRLFGVPKPKPVPERPELSQLRLICNLVLCNSYFGVLRGHIDGLLCTLQWNAITLLDD